jgi:hypothetical protein
MDQAEQHVLSPYEGVVEEPRFILRQHQDSASPIGESLEHGGYQSAQFRNCRYQRSGARLT